MTLIITVLTKRTIYQSADFRLTGLDTGEPFREPSTKLVTLHYGEWDGFVTYTGVGRWGNQDTSEYVMQWLDGMYPATPAEVAERIRDKGTEWLRKIEADRRRMHHTFILAAFNSGKTQLLVISNFEGCSGRDDVNAGPSLTISSTRFEGRPRLVMCGVPGVKRAVSRLARRRLEHLVRDAPDDPARVRRLLAEINAEAAASPKAKEMISPACSVVSVRADGQGVYDHDGAVTLHALTMGTRTPDPRGLIKERLGFDPGPLTGMSTFASAKPNVPYAPCLPRTVMPADAGGYVVCEIRHGEFASCWARDVSNVGVVLGGGHPCGRPGEHVLWTAPLQGEARPCRFITEPGGINDAGEVAAKARMSDGSEHAVRFTATAVIDLGCFRGNDSGAVAINATGLAVGWVCVDPVNRGQINFRPAAWSFDKLSVLENFGCGWGQAVDVNDAGIVLVAGYTGGISGVGGQCRAILWEPLAGTTEVIGGLAGIYPLMIATDGTVLGTARDLDGRSVAFLAKPGQQWEWLGTPPGFYATAMNDAGDVVGAVVRDGYEKPWLRRASGDLIWLPYFDHHWCRPSAINSFGLIVGKAQTDHGSHALVWTFHNTTIADDCSLSPIPAQPN